MPSKQTVLLSCLGVFLFVVICYVIGCILSPESKKQTQFAESVILASAKDPGMLAHIHTSSQQKKNPIVREITSVQEVHIPTDASIDFALQTIVNRTNENFEATCDTTPIVFASAEEALKVRDQAKGNIQSAQAVIDKEQKAIAALLSPGTSVLKEGFASDTTCSPVIDIEGTIANSKKNIQSATNVINSQKTMLKSMEMSAASATPTPASPPKPIAPQPSIEVAKKKIEADVKLQEAKIYTDTGAVKSANMDIGGNDIKCYNDGSGPDFCSKKCHADPTCRGYNYVGPNSGWGANSGCCYKRVGAPLKNASGIDFFAITPSSSESASIAQKAAQAVIDKAKTEAAAKAKAIADAALATKAKAEAAAKLAAENAKKAADLAAALAAKKSYTNANYVKNDNMDIGGNDLECIQDGSGPDVCMAKCDKHPKCRGFNYVPPNSVWGAKSGCCYKSKAEPLAAAGGINFYTLRPNATINGSTAQKGMQLEIDAANKLQQKWDSYNAYTNPLYTKSINKDHAGDDIKNTKGMSPEDCAKQCTSDDKCKAFNYVHNTRSGFASGACFFKSVAAPISDSGHIDFFQKIALPAVPKTAAPPPAPAPAPAPKAVAAASNAAVAAAAAATAAGKTPAAAAAAAATAAAASATVGKSAAQVTAINAAASAAAKAAVAAGKPPAAAAAAAATAAATAAAKPAPVATPAPVKQQDPNRNYTNAGYIKYAGKDSPGNDIANIPGGPDACRDKCDKDKSCQGFSYVEKRPTHPNGVCYYKRNTGKQGSYATTDLFVKKPGDPNEKYTNVAYTKLENTDIRGFDIGNFNESGPDACRQKCDQDAKCVSFNYVHNKLTKRPLGKCYYKSTTNGQKHVDGIDLFIKKVPSASSSTIAKSAASTVALSPAEAHAKAAAASKAAEMAKAAAAKNALKVVTSSAPKPLTAPPTAAAAKAVAAKIVATTVSLKR